MIRERNYNSALAATRRADADHEAYMLALFNGDQTRLDLVRAMSMAAKDAAILKAISRAKAEDKP